jgi:hypothetical protein
MANINQAEYQFMVDMAWVAVIGESETEPWTLGIAERNVSGYHTLDEHWRPSFRTMEEADAVADHHNSILGLTQREASQIVASSMRAQINS